MDQVHIESAPDTLNKQGFGTGIVDKTSPKKNVISRLKKTISELYDNQNRMIAQVNNLQNHINVLQHDQKKLITDVGNIRNGLVEEDED